jgi:hypothetical protein
MKSNGPRIFWITLDRLKPLGADPASRAPPPARPGTKPCGWMGQEDLTQVRASEPRALWIREIRLPCACPPRVPIAQLPHNPLLSERLESP